MSMCYCNSCTHKVKIKISTFPDMIIVHLLKVPLSLGIRISSICGTIRVCMKPPPSDQIWFGFTSMPDIQFNLDSFVGDHKITNARLALFLISRVKVRSFI